MHLRRAGLWLRTLFRPSSVEHDLDEELLHHIELATERNIQAGMEPGEARRRARLDFGGVERYKEQARDARTTRPVENLLSDLRHALRALGKAPGFTVIIILTLAIGIGANTAIFSTVSGVLLKPLPYHESERLVYINTYFHPESGYDFSDYAVGSPEYFDYKNQSRSMEEVAAVSTEPITVTEGFGDPEVVRAGWVSPSMFTVLRTPPILGRTLVEEDGGAEPTQVVVLSYDFWQRRFGGDSTVVGRRMDLGMEVSEEPIGAEIVGVMPQGFGYPDRGIQLWGPLPLDPARTWRGGHWFVMIGRLASGVSIEEAQAEMATLMDQWAVTYPDHHVGHGLQMRPLLEEEVGDSRSALLLLMGCVGFVLLIACANVASLLLARAEGRRREVAVRSALGAGRGRLFQHVISESFILALLGGGLGLVLAWGGVKGLLLLEAGTIPRVEEIGLDAPVLAFTAGVVVLTTFLFGLMPALREATPNPADMLREAGLRFTASSSQMRFRKGIVVAEVALSVLLVVGAGLLIRSFQRMLSEEAGFDTENLFFARFTLPAAEYEPLEALVFFDQLLAGVRGLPTVTSATLTSRPPLRWRDQNGRLHIEGREVAASAPMCCVLSHVVVGDDFISTLGIPLVRGRLFEPSDQEPGSPGTVLIDQQAADRWWPGEDPIGQRVRFGRTDAPWSTVVGIVGNVTYDGPGELWPTYYVPHGWTVEEMSFLTRSSYLTVRTERNAAQALPAIREIVKELDPGLAIAGSYTMDEVLEGAVARPRFIMTLLSVFAGVALILGAIGIYGVISYSVALRAGELGIRRALGAGGWQVVRLVLRQGLVLTGLGITFGMAAALALNQVLQGFLHEVSPTDPLTYLSVGVGVAIVAGISAFLPARRASGADPLDALRIE